jgi:transcription antitermination protein NusB
MKLYARKKARSLVLQAIYQWQLNNDPVSYIEAQFVAKANPKKIDLDYFSEVLRGVISGSAELDAQMQPFLDRKVKDLNPVELAVMRVAIFELLHRPDIPFKVVINEALELAKNFGSTDGHKYVNGILDQVAKKCRNAENKQG